MSTAIQLLQMAYRDHNLEAPSAFSTTTEFPLNIAQDLINEVIQELNKMGNFWFCRTKTAFAYTANVYTYNLGTLEINPNRIEYVRRDSTTLSGGELIQYEYRMFQRLFRGTTIPSGIPGKYSIFNDTIEFDIKPDADYSIFCYHFKDMPYITATTDSQSTGAILVPTQYEDLIRQGCYYFLGSKIGKWDHDKALLDLKYKAQPFLIVVKSNSGIPTRMPAAF